MKKRKKLIDKSIETVIYENNKIFIKENERLEEEMKKLNDDSTISKLDSSRFYLNFSQ